MTIGPASSDKEVLRGMINNGMNIARINMAYSNYEFCMDIINKINELNKKMNKYFSIMLDLEGPDIKVVKNLNLYYGIYPVLINECNSFDSIMDKSKEIVKNILENKFGRIIITGGYPFNKVKHTNFMKIEEL